MRLAEPIVRAVAAEGYTTPTPIQAKAIPEAMAGRDVLGTAQTGTGKTCAFALPILHRLYTTNAPEARPEPQPAQEPAQERGRRGRNTRKTQPGRSPRALILCPTRELASQIYDSFVTYGRNLPLRHTTVYGGVNQGRQVRALRSGVDVLVATPGRLMDLIEQGLLDLRSIETLVLDEADRMLDMGFINDIRKIIKMLPSERQTLLFTATLSPQIRGLADSILRDPVHIKMARESATLEAVTQRVYLVNRQNKAELLERLLGHADVGRALVFTRTKHGADKLVQKLERASIRAAAIHGNKSQNARDHALRGFRKGSPKVLVATDVASRGIDVDEITHVVNFDMPNDPETYVHRIGRTARAGALGTAISFCDRDEAGVLRAIERQTRSPLEVADDAPDLAQTAYPAAPASRRERPTQHAPRRGRSGPPPRSARSNGPRGSGQRRQAGRK